MMKFEVGQPLPPLQPPGFETSRSTFNSAFFDVVYWIPGTEDGLIPIWKKSKLQYGLFVANNIPFLIFNFPNQQWNFDVSLNIKKVRKNNTNEWLNGESNIINLYLCDCKTNLLLAQRMIAIETEVSEKIRDVLEQQDQQFNSSDEVDNAINVIMQSHTTVEMMKKTKMTSF